MENEAPAARWLGEEARDRFSPKMARGGGLNSRFVRVWGLGGVSAPSDRDHALRTERGTRWLQVGCDERATRQRFSETENV